ncbi:MAG TPA: molybdate ABC transporter substrate-binding protein [Candidatus Brevibacterium intestinavium]|jgi:molybdate transport system substrate-binding protein|uniref:molybdate ABC transporter substrate-binding protein n=1 Tax=Brevibacterium sp. TaxID=1701 RepID=UPI001F8F2363|nr:molybdate ABC transporter substrate-binding protein [Brevibacterium sp.]HJA61901.1 molybdate ABC transporter substrate-binding protein [Candidatus Brevibacterium intestinavium]
MKTALTGLCIVAALTLSACSSGGDAQADSSDSTEITVFAAASLTEVFEDIADEFESAEPGAPTVKFSFAGSSDLVSQISEGAPADVIATADEETMDTLDGDDLLARQPSMFASNTLTLAVAEGNPESITSSRDFAGHDLVICAPQVPCGAATNRWAGLNDVDLDPVSEENSVTDVLGKVSAGQADAGIVYVTDIARAGGQVEQVDLDGADKVINKYPAAPVADSENREQAEAFVEFLGSDTAQKLLRDAGFAAA